MKETSPGRVPDDEHRQIQLDLPWFLNGTLPSERAARIERHLASCPECRAEIELDEHLLEHMRLAAVVEPAARAPLAAVLERIDTRERRQAWWRNLSRFFVGPSAPIRRRPLVAAIGFQSVAILVLAGVLVATHLLPAPSPAYRTLTAPPERPVPEAAALNVIFDDALTTAEVRALLADLNATIVAGPTPAGVFTVAVDPPSLDLENGRPIDADALAARLRSQRGVRFAEPLR